VPTKAKLQEPA